MHVIYIPRKHFRNAKVPNVNSFPNGQTGYKWTKGTRERREETRRWKLKSKRKRNGWYRARQMGEGERTGLVAELEQARYAKFGT